ncbi:MAG: ParB/RepB/Spo0J family partition protein [Terracidiphilus sp.]|jgi:vacuolar-type H+-ATPase subunit I/STV1
MADPVTIKLEYLSPDSLHFDPENPRFGGSLKDKSQPEIQKAIFGAPHYASELVDSFLENGFIDYEPLVVRRQGDHYVVVEGNRRLAAVNEIRANPEKYERQKNDFDKVPAIVFPDQADDEQQQSQMRIYLGVRHMLGFREWPPLAKAQFLEREIQRVGSLERTIKEVRIKKQEARRFLLPFRLLKKAGMPLPDSEDFWVLAEAISRTGVKKFLQLDVDPDTLQILDYDKANLKVLLDDLYGPRMASTRQRNTAEKKVHDTRELSTYASVLSSEKASALLHGGKSLREAEIYVDTREESRNKLSKVVRELGLLIQKVLEKDKTPEATAVLQAFKELNSAVKAYLKKHA